MATKNTLKLLVPLATAAVAAAVAVGSGASWTSESVSTTDVTAGALDTDNDSDAKVLNVSNMKPGDVLTGSVTITNSGSVPAELAMKQNSSSNTFFLDDVNDTPGDTTDDVSDLQLKVVRDDTTVIYEGNFGGFSSDLLDLTNGTALAGEDPDTTALEGGSTTIKFMVRLIATADTSSQSKTASASFTFQATPADGETGLTGDFETPPPPPAG